MKNDFVTDVFYFRFNRKNNIKKNYSTIFTVTSFFHIFTILMIILPIVIVNSLPDNEIELPKDVSNDYKNGLAKADNLVTNDYNNSYNNYDGLFKHLHRRKGGKHHHKKNKSRKHSKLDYKKENNVNFDVKESKPIHKYIEQTGNKFDYYPIEPVNITYDSKEEEKIRFVLIAGEESDKDENKPTKENKKKRRRNKRDVLIPNDANSLKLKRNIEPSNYQSSNYIQNSDANNNLNANSGKSFKFAVRGIYHNPNSPRDYDVDKFLGLPDKIITRADQGGPFAGNAISFESERGPIWDRRPVPRQKPRTTTTTTTTTPNPDLLGVNPTPPPSVGPSNCIWAIVNCCSKNDLTIRYSCFDQIGCVGAFWFSNPCGDNWQRGALEEADKFFEEEDDY